MKKTNKGKNISLAIEYVQRIFRESNQVIRHLDNLMEKESYSHLYGNTVTRDLSHDLEKPEQWLPDSIFRYYRQTDDNKTIRGITITYWNDEEPIEEPILIGAVFTCSKFDVQERKYWDIWRLWFKDDEEKLKSIDGNFHDCNLEDEEVKDRIIKAKVFAIPLVSISSNEDIYNKVYKRLIE